MRVSSFKYLGRVLSASDGDWQVVVTTLRKAQKKLAHLSRVLGKEGADAQTLGTFYMAAVQLVLLFRSRMWVTSPCIGGALGRFHQCVIRQLTG